MGEPLELVVMGFRGNPQKYTVKPDITVAEFIRKISEKIGIPAAELHLVYKGKELSHTDLSVLTGEKYKVTNKGVFHMQMRFPGGPDPRRNMRLKKHELSALPPYISITYTEPCCITFCEPEGNERFAKMPCGHVISPSSMTSYCQSLLDNGKFQFNCPVYMCNREWPYYLVRHVACLTEEEEKMYDEKIIENFNGYKGVKDCPGCKTSFRRQNATNHCIRCPLCTRENAGNPFEFCWFCLKTWSGANYTSDCGNENCVLRQRLHELATCPEKEIGYIDMMCPSARACPNCKSMIYHTTGCKQMQCKMKPCGIEFCFVCLKPRVDGNWQCGDSYKKCQLAPRQTTI